MRWRKEIPTTFQLLCPAFGNGGNIPQKFTAEGSDTSPTFAWTEPPPDTKEFALVMEEPDAPTGGLTHWMAYGISADMHGLPEGQAKEQQLANGIRQGMNDFDKIGYAGPRPIPGASCRYVFQIYALNSVLDLKPAATRAEFGKAVKGHILAEAILVGRYEAGVPSPGKTQASKSKSSKAAPAASGRNQQPASQQARLRALEEDKEYILQTAQIQRELKDAYAQDPGVVQDFFSRFSLTSAFAEAKIRQYLARVVDPQTRRSLENYVRHANRFRVQFRLQTRPLGFKVMPWVAFDTKSHVKIVGDHFEGAEKTSTLEDSFAASFSSPGMNTPAAVQELIDGGKATYVKIDDHGSYSLLKDLESFAYKDDGVAIVHHDAEQPYFLCIFGEKMKKDVLADLGKSLSEFQKKHFSRSRGGRPAKLDQLKKMLEVDAKPISNIEKAVELTESEGEKGVKSQEVKLSKLRSKIRKNRR